MHGCPCGFYGDSVRECTCSLADIRCYIKKISGPLLDRIDINIHVLRLEYSEITASGVNESSTEVRQRVEIARACQQKRLKQYGLYANAQMGHRHVKNTCKLTPEAQYLLEQAFEKMNLSGRGYDRTLKVARTIADLAGEEEINVPAIAEAIHLRNNVKESVL